MTNLNPTIEPKSDQLNADSLIGRTLTIKVTKVALMGGDRPVAVHYEGDDGKPYLPCKSMRRVLVQLWGSDGSKYAGRSMTLYRDPEIKFGGAEVGGIRISHVSDIDRETILSLTATRGSKKPFKVRPLASTTTTEPDPTLIEAGAAAAAQGVEAYTTWLGSVPAAKKSPLRALHSGWSAIAKQADADRVADAGPLADAAPADDDTFI